MISSLTLPTSLLSVVFAYRICVCKSNNLFLIDQMFFEEILKFFDDLNSFIYTLSILLLRSRIGTAKILIFSKLATFIFKNLKVFFRLVSLLIDQLSFDNLIYNNSSS